MRRIGRYEVCGFLGKGGTSTVYKVKLPVVGKVVALKLLAPHPNLVDLLGEEEVKRRFVAEALTMAHLRHPNLLAIWDFDESEGRPFLVMEYYCNSLGVMIGEHYEVERPSRVLSVEKALHYVRQVVFGLSCLHEAGIVHRDIKPYNVFITDEDTVKIGDFGLSKLRGERVSGPKNLVVGSPYYAAPEQERAPEAVDGRADLYSVGVMLYRMLAGVLPIDGWTRLSRLNPDLDQAWDAFVEQAVASEREERFSSGRAMLAALDELAAQWEEKKEKACRLPEPPSSEAQTAVETGRPLRAEEVRVRPRDARRIFGLDGLWRPERYLANDLRAGGDRATVTDAATGLMWQQGGSDYPVNWEDAKAYVGRLNLERFSGFDDWRLPTVNELMSLLIPPPRIVDLCIASVFDSGKRWLWSCDRRSATAAWYVSADMGFVYWQDRTCYYYVRAVRSL
jgi:serine/threonine protein kinase